MRQGAGGRRRLWGDRTALSGTWRRFQGCVLVLGSSSTLQHVRVSVVNKLVEEEGGAPEGAKHLRGTREGEAREGRGRSRGHVGLPTETQEGPHQHPSPESAGGGSRFPGQEMGPWPLQVSRREECPDGVTQDRRGAPTALGTGGSPVLGPAAPEPAVAPARPTCTRQPSKEDHLAQPAAAPDLQVWPVPQSQAGPSPGVGQRGAQRGGSSSGRGSGRKERRLCRCCGCFRLGVGAAPDELGGCRLGREDDGGVTGRGGQGEATALGAPRTLQTDRRHSPPAGRADPSPSGTGSPEDRSGLF